MPTANDYYWNASDNYAPLVTGASAQFGTPAMITDDDGYGGTNWSIAAQNLTIHVHFQGVSRRVSVVRIKSHNGGDVDYNMIKVYSQATKGVNLKGLARYCNAYPNHQAFLQKLHDAMQTI